MTHVGQLARLRRRFGAACAFSTFILALPQSIAGAQAPDSIRRSASQPRPARALPLVLPSYPIEADAPWVPATVPSVLEVGRIQIVVTTARMVSEFNHRGVGPSVVDDCQRFMLLDTPEYTGARYSYTASDPASLYLSARRSTSSSAVATRRLGRADGGTMRIAGTACLVRPEIR